MGFWRFSCSVIRYYNYWQINWKTGFVCFCLKYFSNINNLQESFLYACVPIPFYTEAKILHLRANSFPITDEKIPTKLCKNLWPEGGPPSSSSGASDQQSTGSQLLNRKCHHQHSFSLPGGKPQKYVQIGFEPMFDIELGKKKLAGLALCRTKWKFHFHFPFCYTLSQGTLWVMFRNRFAGWTWTGRRATTWEKKKNLAVLQVARCRRVSWRNEKKKDC